MTARDWDQASLVERDLRRQLRVARRHLAKERNRSRLALFEASCREARVRQKEITEALAEYGSGEAWETFRRVLGATSPHSTIDSVEQATLVTVAVMNARGLSLTHGDPA